MSETCTPERWFITENDQLGTGASYYVYFIFLFDLNWKNML